MKLEPPPDLSLRDEKMKPKPDMLPKWWNQLYKRSAKGIPDSTWDPLMKPVFPAEVLSIIRESGLGKAAGHDGVSSDLIKLLTDAADQRPTELLEIITILINVALESGQSLESWRKAIVTMIPKRKEDGSFTSLVSEMRPISVLQEFGKIASKLLADRLGRILLSDPSIMNPAQRAFLKDGCTSQCINIALNVLEALK